MEKIYEKYGKIYVAPIAPIVPGTFGDVYKTRRVIMMKRKILVGLCSVCFCGITALASAAGLPNVRILATGGTIAGTANKATTMTGYKAGVLGIQTLIDAVPQIKSIANIEGEQIANLDSKDMTTDVSLKLADRCNQLLARSDVNGIVITHGTDTLEETAYFLNLTVKSKKPVVIIGAMRPATAISADGPVNLLNAVTLAANPKAVGQGVLIAMNDNINAARDTTKTNTSNVATFKAPEMGIVGYFTNGQPYFYRKDLRKNTWQTEFNVKGLKALPRVDIIYTHINDDSALVNAAVAAGAKGIVYAGSGMGSVHKDAYPGLTEAIKKGVVVVRSSRVGNGMVIDDPSYVAMNFLPGDNLNPQKARILLQLALTKTTDLKEIQRMFAEY
jgi:L-asparaginase